MSSNPLSDADEFGADESSDADVSIELKAEFDSACRYLETNNERIEQSDLLFFYAHYKQALCGACNTPRPGLFDFSGKKKWDAWHALGALPKPSAMASYISRLRSLNLGWSFDANAARTDRSLRPSVPVHSQEPENDEDAYSLVSSRQLEKLRALLSDRKSDTTFNINSVRNEDGLTLLHLSCDRGFHEITEFLLNEFGTSIDVNTEDASGQTALHYAASCGHIDCVELLLKHGADTDRADEDGQLPVDVSYDEKIRQLLSNHVK